MHFSVVMPLFDKADYVADAVGSVLDQTHAEFELIVVDDGSSDGSAQRIQRHDPRVRVLSQANAGPGAARNAGTRESRHEWLAFIDADDVWGARFLERIAGLIAASPGLGAIFTNVSLEPSGAALLGAIGVRDGVVVDYFASVLDNAGHGMTCSSTAVRRDRLLACGGFDESADVGEDADTWARLAWSGAVGYVADSLCTHRTAVPGSLISRAHAGTPGRPPFLATYESWHASGGIPRHLAESSRRLARQVRFEWAATLARRKQVHALREAVRTTSDARLTSLDLAGLALRILLPRVLLERLGRRRKSPGSREAPGAGTAGSAGRSLPK